ncbi:MAG: RNA pseudouridine synthase [Acidocella sp. 20-61-6]|nr:MAG: RNA pseudouridine synthase [Acidocella sp. 20-61-6]
MDKPAGLPVHPGRAGGPSVEDFFGQWRRGKAGPWLAHRLDQDTAGCLVIALKKSALLAAQAAFAASSVEKTYWAAVRGVPAQAEGVIDLPLAKVTVGRAWKMAPDGAAPPAITHWRVLGQSEGQAWIEFRPKTGRTHQIRAHAAAIGHPIRGDAVYGGGAGALHLLARAIRLPLDPPLTAEAPVPAHMRAALRACGYG